MPNDVKFNTLYRIQYNCVESNCHIISKFVAFHK